MENEPTKKTPLGEEQLSQLNRQAQDLTDEVAKLGASVGVGVSGLRKRSARHSKAIWLLAGSFLLDVILTVAIVITGTEVRSQSDRIDRVQRVTNEEALCPLYDIFLASSKSPQAQRPGESEAQKKRRLEVYKQGILVIKQGYEALGCGRLEK